MNEAEEKEKRIEIEPGELWVARLPSVAGEMLVLVVDRTDPQGMTPCAVVGSTMAMPYKTYKMASLHRWPLGKNDNWTRVA